MKFRRVRLPHQQHPVGAAAHELMSVCTQRAAVDRINVAAQRKQRPLLAEAAEREQG